MRVLPRKSEKVGGRQANNLQTKVDGEKVLHRRLRRLPKRNLPHHRHLHNQNKLPLLLQCSNSLLPVASMGLLLWAPPSRLKG